MLAIMLFHPKFDNIKYRSFKGILFLTLGIIDTMPVFHLIILRFQ